MGGTPYGAKNERSEEQIILSWSGWGKFVRFVTQSQKIRYLKGTDGQQGANAAPSASR
jgi:hypothetical protein